MPETTIKIYLIPYFANKEIEFLLFKNKIIYRVVTIPLSMPTEAYITNWMSKYVNGLDFDVVLCDVHIDDNVNVYYTIPLSANSDLKSSFVSRVKISEIDNLLPEVQQTLLLAAKTKLENAGKLR